MQWFNAWTVREVLDYLDDHFLTVVDAKTGPYLQKHPDFPASAAAVAAVLPHLSAHRDAVLDHFRGMAARAWEGPTAGPCPHLAPAEGRRVLFGAMRFVAASVGGRVGTFDRHTRLMGYVDDRDAQFRPGVTAAVVYDRDGAEFTHWTDVPGAHAPPGWTPPEKPAPRWNPWAHEKPAAADFDGLPD